MFYPEHSLKRGGRFYLCWVADSWPLQFDTIPQRQLWSQDVRTICDALLEVITCESGRPANRFSLRLSSQLMHGLVRLYQKKVKFLLGDLHMINANVFKHTNKKYRAHDEEAIAEVRRPPRPLPQLQMQTAQELPEEEQRLEEMIQNSANVVANIQDITLKESVIPEIQLPNDGFGEENPDQPIQMLQDRTMEMMLLQTDASAVQHSGLDFALDVTDKSHDKSRLAPHESAQMETIEEQDVSLFKKSTGAELVADFEKDIPEIPEIPPPEMPVPPADKIQEVIPSPEPALVAPVTETTRQPDSMEIELEELEPQPQSRRRRRNKLIIDKKIRLSADFIRSRINNPFVEVRCQDSSDDVIEGNVLPEVFMRRPAHAGSFNYSNFGYELLKLFMRNLGPMPTTPLADRDMETALHRSRRDVSRSLLERIEEEPEPAQLQPQLQPMDIEQVELDTTKQVEVEQPPIPRVVIEPMDFSDMPTQKIVRLSPQRKRSSEEEDVITPKRLKSGVLSFKEKQLQAKQKQTHDEIEHFVDIQPDANKENIPENIQPPTHTEALETLVEPERHILSLLQESGLADVTRPETEPAARRTRSDSSETMLGSLDRTRVSLGDSDHTTDSKRLIREKWGTEGTMSLILRCLKAAARPVSLRAVLARGPAPPGHQRLVAAKCFTSILKLKQNGFVDIQKDEKLEIADIILGPKLSMFRS